MEVITEKKESIYHSKENNNYNVRTEVFEGPLGVLLNMIERRKLFINDVSLSQIADDYLSYIQNTRSFSISDSADFILIASALMLIKSRSLLPNLDLTREEEKKIDDLEDRLKSYKRTKELSLYIKEKFGKEIIFKKSYKRNSFDPIFSPDRKITKKEMFALAVELLTKLPKKQIKDKKTVKKIVSLDEVIENLSERIRKNMKISFNKFSQKEKAEKINIVISFLAMLELFKQGIISVNQNIIFGDIDMESKKIDVPYY